MTGSVEDLRAGLLGVAELLNSATGYASRAAVLIDEAIAILAPLGEGGALPLPPDGLRAAAEEVQRGLAAIHGGGLLVGDIETRL